MHVKIDLKIFLFLVIFIITKQIKIYAILMLFALMHELGHLIMGVALGFSLDSLSIVPVGFTVKFTTEPKSYNIKIKKGNLLTIYKILIAIAGPLVNIIIILCSIMYYKITQNVQIYNLPIDLIIYANALIFIFNLIPIYPLDGGRILKGIIHIFAGIYQSYTITNKISNVIIILLTVISSIAILLYKNIAILLIIAYLWLLIINENKKFNAKMQMYKTLNCKFDIK